MTEQRQAAPLEPTMTGIQGGLLPEGEALPLVSVIVPVYNDRQGLTACLEALGRQTYPRERFEVVVVDNGSGPAHDPEIEVSEMLRLIHEPEPGSYRARNAGLRAARGSILAFTDSDCRPLPDWIQAGVARLTRSDRPVLLAGEVEVLARDAAAPTLAERYELATAFPQEHNVTHAHFGVTANLMTWREVVRSVGEFRDDLRSGGDLEWGNRAFEAGWSVVYAPEVRVTHPARRTLGQLIDKSRRLAAGKLDLQRPRGLALSGTFKEFLPSPVVVRRLLTSPAGDGGWTRLRLLGLHLLLRQVRFWERLRRILGAQARR